MIVEKNFHVILINDFYPRASPCRTGLDSCSPKEKFADDLLFTTVGTMRLVPTKTGEQGTMKKNFMRKGAKSYLTELYFTPILVKRKKSNLVI